MKKQGIAYLFVLLIMIPVFMMIFAIMDLSITNYKLGIDLIDKKQAEYNCEIGLKDGINRCSSLVYKNRQAIYYIDFKNNTTLVTTTPDSKDFDQIIITYSSLNLNQKYLIDVIGTYMESTQEKTIIYNGG